jgi:hypothetical protein
MKNSIAALAAIALSLPVLSAPSVEAASARRPAGTGTGYDLDWFALTPPSNAAPEEQKGARRRLVRSRPAPADKEAKAVKAAEGGQVAASAQVVRTPPVAKTTAAAKVAAGGASHSTSPGQSPAALDCRKYIPTAGMTISVACTD